MTPQQHRPHYQTESNRFMHWIRQLTLTDNPFMEACLHENTACATLMLRVILDRTDLEVERVTVQKTLPNLYGHGVRFDILAVDREERHYDIEMQVGGLMEELVLRARMYSSVLDMHQLKAGEDYRQLREHWVIFIVDRDLFGLELPLYRVERCVLGKDEGAPVRLFGDNAHICFANSAIRGSDTPLSRLMHDLNCPDPESMYYAELAEAVRHHKTHVEGVRKMSGVFEQFERGVFERFEREIGPQYLARGMEQGIAQGMEQGMARGMEQGIAIGEDRSRRTFALRLLADGLAVERVAQYTSLPLEEVLTLANKGTGDS